MPWVWKRCQMRQDEISFFTSFLRAFSMRQTKSAPLYVMVWYVILIGVHCSLLVWWQELRLWSWCQSIIVLWQEGYCSTMGVLWEHGLWLNSLFNICADDASLRVCFWALNKYERSRRDYFYFLQLLHKILLKHFCKAKHFFCHSTRKRMPLNQPYGFWCGAEVTVTGSETTYQRGKSWCSNDTWRLLLGAIEYRGVHGSSRVTPSESLSEFLF